MGLDTLGPARDGLARMKKASTRCIAGKNKELRGGKFELVADECKFDSLEVYWRQHDRLNQISALIDLMEPIAFS